MENSKPMLFPVTLNGDNYLLWSRTTKNVLGHRGLLTHIEAAKDENVEEEKKEKWLQEDMGVLGALQSSLEVSILEAYSYCEKARDLWDVLQTVFGNVSNFTRVFEVKKAINNLSQEDMGFKQHFGKFRSLWAELEMLRPFSVDPKVLKERQEHDKVFGLLLTLSPTFNDLIKHILRADKLPNLDEVCSKLQKEEGSIGLFSEKGCLPTANKGVFNQGEKKVPVCDHCKKKGHSKEKCWILNPHLKPAKFKDTRAHLASKEVYTGVSLSGPSSNEEKSVVPYQAGAPTPHGEGTIMLNKADLEALLTSIASKMHHGTTLYSHKPGSSLVVDSGASHHMISNPNLINNIEPALGNVSIENGSKVPIEGVGDLNLFGRKSKALFMPKFTSNLLSVKKTTKDLDCLAIFSPDDVKLQDIKSRKSLDKDKQRMSYMFLELPLLLLLLLSLLQIKLLWMLFGMID